CEDIHSSSGNAFSIAANRLSFAFDLQGPSVAVDTACSSSLFAVHFACQSLRTGDSNLALAGGVNLIFSPYGAVHLSRMGLMSPTGRCRTFDAGADGFVRGEGCGVVVLKRLSDAVADGDHVYATIRGSAVNNDGRTNGLTAPNGLSQQAVVRMALASARVQPSQVSYVEAHGTGTPLGDPIEVESLSAVYRQANGDAQTCLLGSVKTNVGHMEAAAGIAAFIKVVLSLEHEQIPPHLHFQKLNPHIELEGTRLEVATRGRAWPRGETARYAGVSSFGFGGANAHVILEEGPADAAAQQPPDTAHDTTYLLPLSARSPEALPALAQRYLDHLGVDDSSLPTLRDLCYTAGARRSHHQHRLCVAAHSYEQLRQRLTAYLSGDELAPDVFTGSRPSGRRPKVAFVFSGQGSQWAGMGRGLFETEPVFRQKVEECAEAMRPHLDGWALLDHFTSTEDETALDRIDVVQPLLFAVQVGLAAVWRSWGVEPDAVVGHSMGEVAAAHVSGALSLEDAARVICLRGRLLRRLSGRGAMAVVELPAEQAEAAIASEQGVEVAASNGPRTTVVSGEAEAVRRLVAKWQAGNVYSREVAVDAASHSRQVEEIVGELLQALEGVRGVRCDVAMYSTVEGREVSGEELSAEYWARNLRERVKFAEAVGELRRRGFGAFVEVGPHPVLTMAIEECVRAAAGNGATARGAAVVVGTLRKETVEGETIREAAGRLYAGGVDVSWEAIGGGRGKCVKLPGYPWQRQRYWFESDGPQQTFPGNFLRRSAAAPVVEEQVGDWLYELHWQPETVDEDSGAVETTPEPEGADATAEESGTWVIFADKHGVAQALAARLGASQARTLLVYTGTDFQRLSESEYQLDPAQPEQFQSLLREAAAGEQSRLT
ncbi:MAG TPA: type I polyketide synthase, partial [Pyrinomonadaceae bacterium]